MDALAVRIAEVKKSLQLLSCCLFLLLANTVLAQEPAVLQMGNIDVTPTLSTQVDFDDNIFRSDGDEVDSVVSFLSPSVLAEYTDQVNSYQLALGATKGLYSATSEDDYTGWNLEADAHLEFTRRHLVDFSLAFEDSVQPRGTGFSQFGDLPESPDQFESRNAGLSYQYGADDSLARLVLSVSQSDMEFTNNETFVRGRDFEGIGWGSAIFYNVMPRTDFVLEVRGAELDYDDEQFGAGGLSQLDSTDFYAYVGATWEATALTTGSVRVGLGEKDFDSPSREDAHILSYEANIQYAPLTYSIFTFTAEQNFSEGLGFGDAVEQRNLELNWGHEWSQRFSTQIGIADQNFDYVGSPVTDKFKSYFASVSYQYRRWLSFNIGVRREDRDSSGGPFQFERNVFTIGFEASM